MKSAGVATDTPRCVARAPSRVSLRAGRRDPAFYMAVVCITASWTSRSPEMMSELRELVRVLSLHEVSLRTRWIKSADNYVADFWSRIARPREYQLSPTVFDTVALWYRDFSPRPVRA